MMVEYKLLSEKAQAPVFMRDGDAGADICTTEAFVLAPGERKMVHTGVAIAVPDGYAAFVHPRSSLAAMHGISVVNAPGTIDAGYRGEVCVILINHGDVSMEFSEGQRIAQLVFQRVEHPSFVFVREFTDDRTERGTGGFGSTGTV
ncbi:deoxyuridine triphosphatase [Streptomyces phage SparkleGoddess]|uniref:dUTP diphosphatase n=1 Tax=Streptomyces phage SparkleGoddess TaxID=2283305 RepID=A0A345MDZ5_9CAUD|nr:deoxyuridine triphosphatase [Streptomyces phage SparkleGoddess]UTN92317.1 deoxyuridine triphosphatase [Streptomyces phage Stigma]